MMKFVWDLNRTFNLEVTNVEEWKEHPSFAVLMKANEKYRAWLADNPEKKDHYLLRSDGEIPKQIVDMLQDICSATTNLDDAYELSSAKSVEEFTQKYPGISNITQDFLAHRTEINGVLFNTEFDINAPDERILPSFKHASAYFELPLSMNEEQIQEMEKNSWRDFEASNMLIVGIAYCAGNGLNMTRIQEDA